MKVVPYLRFCVALFILYKLSDIIGSHLEEGNTQIYVVNIIMDCLSLLYIYYLFKEAILEIRENFNSKFKVLRIFGLIFHFLIFIGGTIVLLFSDWSNVKPFNGFLSISFILELFVLILVDYKKIRTRAINI
ncbi:hypothetical protein [Fulvivirga lutimaris]|uniref:hypothetical protein n=1 Tax=Fulvivirga lutimaris TaxID=1819566 RepID=UPI0012BBA3BF|nr:hypothetical protein [Fulvivirga lutimaris]MTI40919.1 hypothetical protein [Fulvivirga lutimaris]